MRKTLTVSASANGTIEPIRIVEVKSRASGEVIGMPVETGMVVEKGALLVQIDRRDATTALEQAKADLAAAEARLAVARSAKQRSDVLFAEGLTTSESHDAAVYENANAEAAAIKARSTRDNASERLGDTTVRATSAGTILEKAVEVGQMIASAVTQVSGGTALMRMADLTRVQVRTLIDEADIGNLAPGQTATIEVEAHPGRKFEGTLVKIEPQAVASQTVTLFPVLIELENADGLLMPGMTADVDILVSEKENAIVVPREVLKPVREAAVIAKYLGATGAPEMAGNGGGGGGTGGQTGRGGSGAGSASDAAGGSRERGRGGAQAAEVGGRTDAGGRAGAPSGDSASVASRRATVGVFVRKSGGGYEWRLVTTGLQNWRETEIVSGLEEGDEVAIPPSGQFLMSQTEMRNRMRSMSGVPGMQRQTPAQTQTR